MTSALISASHMVPEDLALPPWFSVSSPQSLNIIWDTMHLEDLPPRTLVVVRFTRSNPLSTDSYNLGVYWRGTWSSDLSELPCLTTLLDLLDIIR